MGGGLDIHRTVCVIVFMESNLEKETFAQANVGESMFPNRRETRVSASIYELGEAREGVVHILPVYTQPSKDTSILSPTRARSRHGEYGV